MTTDLLPCPFCGGEAETDSDDRTSYAFVRCCDCGAQAGLEAWDRRQDVPNAAAGWRSIETAPKDGRAILLTGGADWGDDPVHRVIAAFWHQDEWLYAYWDSCWRSAYKSPTHWMPLPASPLQGTD